MGKYLYLSAICICAALRFVDYNKDGDEPGGEGAIYGITIEQSRNFHDFVKPVVVAANSAQLKDEAMGESLVSPLILNDEELAIEKMTLTATERTIEFAVPSSVVDGKDGVVNEPMQWAVTAYKNGKETKKRSLFLQDGKEIGMDDFNLYYN